MKVAADINFQISDSPIALETRNFIDNDLICCDKNAPYLLVVERNGLNLTLKENPKIFYRFDFNEILFKLERQKGHKGDPLFKAIRLQSGIAPLILDATCGTGNDSMFLVHYGARVIAYEKHPIIYLLLKCAYLRTPRIHQQFSLNFGDAINYQGERPHIIYFDPMYPEKKKSARSRKEMELFKELVGESQRELEMLSWARKMALSRVVVKRPPKGESISPDHNFSLTSKAVRFDIYLPT